MWGAAFLVLVLTTGQMGSGLETPETDPECTGSFLIVSGVLKIEFDRVGT